MCIYICRGHQCAHPSHVFIYVHAKRASVSVAAGSSLAVPEYLAISPLIASRSFAHWRGDDEILAQLRPSLVSLGLPWRSGSTYFSQPSY